MDKRLRELERAWRQDPDALAGNARYLRELERLVFGGDRKVLPSYAGAGGVWIEDLTNRRDILDAEGLPVEKDVPVFRFWGVPHRGNRLVVTVRDLLEGSSAPMQSQVEYWLPRTQAQVYGHWELPDAPEQMDTIDMLLGYNPSLPEQRDVRDRALAFFKGRLTEGSGLVTRQRAVYEPQVDSVYDVYRGLSNVVSVPTLVGPETLKIGRDEEALQALVGKSVRDTKRILKGVTGITPTINRPTSRRFQNFQGAVVLGRGVVGFGIYAYDFLHYGDYGRALGWSSSPAQNFSSTNRSVEKFE